MPITDNLGTRMKGYEQRNQYWLQKRIPVCIRVDMRAGHTFTRDFKRPFDEIFIKSIQKTAKYMCENIAGAIFSYQQSDEITIILQDYKNLNTEAWFNYRTDKLCSIAASMATLAFNKYFNEYVEDWWLSPFVGSQEEYEQKKYLYNTYTIAANKGAMFDARCFNIPKEEVTNLIYWRQLDAARNSIQMVGQAYFSHKELQNKSCSDIQDMLMEKYNINWNDFPTTQKRGSCAVRMEIQNPNVDIKDGAYPREIWCIDNEIPQFKGEGREYIESRINFEEE